MPVVYEDLKIGDVPAFRAVCTYTLVGGGGNPIDLAYNASLETVVGSRLTRANSIGRTTIDLDPNSTITPSGTRWRREVLTDGATSGADSVCYILVPDGPGPYNLLSLLSFPPPVIVDPDVEALLQQQILDLQAELDQLEEDVESIEGTPLFIQDDAPVTTLNTYLWIQTNYQVPGGLTFWVEDGS